jgi:AcrR family transcriptional regulator
MLRDIPQGGAARTETLRARNSIFRLDGRVAPQTNSSAGKRDTAETILDAAEHLCATHGIEGVSIRDVAAEASVSIPVIYHYYKSRTNLLRAILQARFSEIAGEYHQLLSALEVQESPAVRDIVRAVLQPINHWRRPGREASLQFYALALVCPLPEVKDALDAGVVGFHRVVALLQRALPRLTHEDICWRLHFTVKISHENHFDQARLKILSKGDCNSADEDEALARGIAFAEAAFLAPRFTYKKKSTNRGRTKTRRRPN